MKYPFINKQPRRTVTIPDLVGGVNLRDGVSDILDNQLTECKNVWHYNGLLRTRPNLKAHIDNKVIIGRATSDQTAEHKEHRDIQRMINAKQYVLCSSLIKNDSINRIVFWWQGEEDVIRLPGISFTQEGIVSYFVVEKRGVLYCFNSVREIHKLDYSTETEWTQISDKYLYVPLLATNCDGYAPYSYADTNAILKGATMIETFNLIGKRVKIKYNTVNKSRLDLSNAQSSHTMEYAIPYVGEACTPTDIYPILNLFEVNVTLPNGIVVNHKCDAAVDGSQIYETNINSGDNLKIELMLNGDTGNLYFKDSSGNVKTVTISDYIENNMEVIIPYSYSYDEAEKVFGMTNPVWFGGAASGLNGGSRLFLGGNSKENSLMVWSALDDPLYFPENNYSYVGKNSNAITAFGKQDDMLVILKENEVYYTHYVQNNNITADDLINQSVIDYQASSVYFPLVQLNAEIGCNVPDSVQLCRNRLIWANTNGNIYTLVSANQYSERNIYKVSAMIERDVLIPPDATSADWNGYYCLMCFNEMWLLKYDSYGYQYVHSYSKAEDAALKMPWFKWKFPFIYNSSLSVRQRESRICLLDGSLILRVLNDMWAGQNVNISTYTLNAKNANTEDEILLESDNGEIIKSTYSFESIAQTKIFDFGLPSYRKNVDVVNVGLGNNGGVPVGVSFVTDIGTGEEEIIPYGAEITAYQPAYINNYRLSPCIRNVCRFGVRLKCNGVLAVDNLNLQYRLLGGAK